MNTLRKLLGLCVHKWKFLEKLEVVGDKSLAVRRIMYVLQCEHCGKIKTKTVTV